MTKALCVEPVFRAGTLSSFTVFNAQNAFLYHHFSSVNDSEVSRYFRPLSYQYICYDAFKTLNVFGDRFDFLWDVKILYDLLGYKTDNFIKLSQEILGNKDVEKYVDLSSKINAHITSYKEARIDLSGYKSLDYLPEDLVLELYLERAKITANLFFRLTEEQKEFYRKFYKSVVNLYKISLNPVLVDLKSIEDRHSHFAYTIRNNVKNGKAYLHFNAAGAKTGRLGFKKGTLNLYTLPKDMRKCIVANPGFKLVEVDFKSFQPRIAIFSTENEEFKDIFRQIDDIYSILPGDREKNKISFLAWMYAKVRIPNENFDKYLGEIWELRNALARTARSQGFLKTRWGRKIYCKDEPKHIIFQNFITATEVDCILNLMDCFLNMGVSVKLPFHDAIICEVPENYDVSVLREVSEKFFREVFDARFPVGIKEGKSFGSMHEI